MVLKGTYDRPHKDCTQASLPNVHDQNQRLVKPRRLLVRIGSKANCENSPYRDCNSDIPVCFKPTTKTECLARAEINQRVGG